MEGTVLHETKSSKPKYADSMEDYKTLLHLSVSHLTLKDFTNARKYALLAHKTHPNSPDFPQIATIAAVHIAAANRLPNDQIDWFSVLQLENTPANHDIQTIRTQFKNLLLLLHPSKNQFPFAGEGFQIVCDAWSVLSDPNKRTQFHNVAQNLHGGVKETFWTMCPYCYFLYEYEGMYKDCCLRCQNCKRPFHGVPVAPPEKDMVMEGKEEYYCGFGWFPLKYYDSSLDEKKEKNDNGNPSGMNDNVKTDELKSPGLEEGVKGKVKIEQTEKPMRGSGGKRVKSTALNTKKIMGRGKRVRVDTKTELGDVSRTNEEENGSENLDFSFDDLEFTIGEDEIYVRLKKQN